VSRELKPQKLERIFIEDRPFDLMFDRNRHQFFITLTEGVEAREDSARACKDAARTLAKKLKRFEWRQAILIPEPEDATAFRWGHHECRHTAEIKVAFMRCELSPHPMSHVGEADYRAKTLVRLYREDLSSDWEEDTIADWEHGKLLLGVAVDRYIELPYDETTWVSLLRLKSQIDIFSAKLDEMLKQGAKAPDRLVKALQGTRLLGGGKQSVSPNRARLRRRVAT